MNCDIALVGDLDVLEQHREEKYMFLTNVLG